MIKKLFPKYPPFINRIHESKYLNDYLKDAPTNILFVYWPKSTGKTTLINKVINELPQKDYAIQYIDMRWVLIRDFNDFKNIFFPEDLKGKVREIVSGIKFDVWFFGWDIDDEKLMKTNIFALMTEKLKKANEKGIKPIIILDEFQYLKNIIIDKENNLLLSEELFKFFIKLTKVNHLAHIICATSDSYYIEELYNHAKLKNTSKYFLVDHLDKKDIIGWLQDENFEEKVIEYFWEHLWGSVWEIWQCIMDYKNTGDYKTSIQTLIDDEYAKIIDFYKYDLQEDYRELFDTISKKIAKDGEYIIEKKEIIPFELIKKTVDLDIWFFDARKQRLTANSQTTRKAFERF